MLKSLLKNHNFRLRLPLMGKRRPLALSCSLAVLAAAGVCAPAMAELSDTLHPFVALNYTHDDNLLRLADGVSGPGGVRSDNIRQIQAGLLLERPIGRQILTGQAKLSKVSFDHFNQFDYDGKDLLAALEWHLGNQFDGHVGASYAQTLTPFTDFHTDERNLRVQRREYVDGGWRFHPSWRVYAGFTRDRFTYDLQEQRFNDRTEDATQVGIDYLPSTRSRVGIVLRRLKGAYANHRFIGGFDIDEGYVQNEVKANIYWYLGAVTQIQFLGGWVERKHDFFTQRDANGANGRLVVAWQPLGKVRFTGTAWREFTAVESNLVSNSLNKGVSVGAVWDATAKLQANAQLRREKRDFNATSGNSFTIDASDNSRTASLGLTYFPKPLVQLGVSVLRDVRSGSPLVTGNYSANSVSVNASAQF